MAVPSALGLRVGVQTSDPLGRVAAPFALPTGRVAAPSHHVHIPAGAPGLSAAGPEHDLPRRASHSPTRQPLPVCAAAMVHTQEVAIPLERGSARMAMHAAACVTQLTSAPGACAASVSPVCGHDAAKEALKQMHCNVRAQTQADACVNAARAPPRGCGRGCLRRESCETCTHVGPGSTAAALGRRGRPRGRARAARRRRGRPRRRRHSAGRAGAPRCGALSTAAATAAGMAATAYALLKRWATGRSCHDIYIRRNPRGGVVTVSCWTITALRQQCCDIQCTVPVPAASLCVRRWRGMFVADTGRYRHDGGCCAERWRVIGGVMGDFGRRDGAPLAPPRRAGVRTPALTPQ